MLIQQRFIKFPCFVIFFFVWLNDQKIMFVLAPKRHMTMHIWSQGNWQTTLDRKCCICCILGYITQTTPKTSPSEQRHQLLGMFLGIMYIAHYAGYWFTSTFGIKSFNWQIVFKTRDMIFISCWMQSEQCWNVLFTSKHNFKRYIL